MYSAIQTVRYGPISCCSSPYIVNGASPELYDKCFYYWFLLLQSQLSALGDAVNMQHAQRLTEVIGVSAMMVTLETVEDAGVSK